MCNTDRHTNLKNETKTIQFKGAECVIKMRMILVGFLMTLHVSAMGAGKDIGKCESFLMAPQDLKQATRAILNGNTGRAKRLEARAQIAEFVKQADIGNQTLARFLIQLAEENADQVRDKLSRDFVERQLVSYLMKQGNADLAAESLPTILSIFWYDVVFGQEDYFLLQNDNRERLAEGYAFSQKIIRFIKYLSESHPQKVRAEWRMAYSQHFRLLLKINGFERMFAKTAAYLERRASQSQREALHDERYANDPDDYVYSARQRLAYITEVIEELEHPTDVDADSLMKLYKIKDENFANNETFELDMNLCTSGDNDHVSPVRSLIFLIRLARTHRDLPQHEMDKIEKSIQKIKHLLVPRGGPSHNT